MKKFGLDNKSKDEGSTRNVEISQSKSELDKLKAARLARFGAVDPADLKSKFKQGGEKKRDKKQKQKKQAGGKGFK
jgi:hypothetical protein